MDEYRINGLTIKENLLQLAENENKKFTESLHPGIENVLGIRIPALRRLGAQIAKDDWESYLQTADTYYMEERMLQGMVISNLKMKDTQAYLSLVARFVAIINSWSVCDTFDFYGKQRFVDKNKKRVWLFLEDRMKSDKEYEIRFGVVMAMAHYIDEEYIDNVLQWMDRISHEGYYVKMAVAWALSVCYVKFPQKTMGSPDKSGGKFFNSIENLHLCTMNNQGLLALAQLILPSEILSNFEVVRVEEEASLIRIYLDESVKAEYKENPEIESKGFCEAVTIRDFPIRDKGVDLIVRRRKWYDKQNNRYFSDSYDLKAEETRYSKEFAAFLKGVYGDDSYDLPFA